MNKLTEASANAFMKAQSGVEPKFLEATASNRVSVNLVYLLKVVTEEQQVQQQSTGLRGSEVKNFKNIEGKNHETSCNRWNQY